MKCAKPSQSPFFTLTAVTVLFSSVVRRGAVGWLRFALLPVKFCFDLDSACGPQNWQCC